MDTPSAGARLKEWRAAAGRTLVAASSAVGVTHSSWCEWESGNRSPSLEKALAVEELTEGAVPVEAWGFPSSVVATMGAVLALRAGGNRHVDPNAVADLAATGT